jgi:hypothetical protein
MIRNAKKIFFALTMITLMVMVSVSPVHALPTTGTFDVIFDQDTHLNGPDPVPNAGSGTFTSVGDNAGNVTSNHFEFTTPINEDFSAPSGALTWNGIALSGNAAAEYFPSIYTLELFTTLRYEIVTTRTFYIQYNLGSSVDQCTQDNFDDSCVIAAGNYRVTLVPEPASMALLLSGLTALFGKAFLRRRPNRRS